jgi:hypothetical protein
MTRRQAERACWIAGSLGVAGAIVGWILAPQLFAHAWLAALVVFLGWPLGCMGLLFTHALTGGRWADAIRPQLLAGLATLPLVVPVLLPLVGLASTLYPWMRPDIAAHLTNQFYLNVPFFVGRIILYLIIWYGLAALTLRALRREPSGATLARLAPAGLILLALTGTYATIDATMSLDPHFASSVYGLVEIVAMGLFALSLSILAAAIALPPGRDSLQELGRLTLGLVVLWAYLDFVQLLIVWQSNLPHEASWYLIRLTGGWGLAAAGVAAAHFLLPFFALLFPPVQRSRAGIAAVAALLVLSAILRGWWVVVPASGRAFGLIDVAAMVGLLGVAAALALRAPLMPMLPEAMRRHV